MTQLPNDPMTYDSRSWYVIQTKPGNEHRVEMNLFHQEIEVFLPLLETFQYSHAKVLQKIKPLFSNYLFAKLDIDAHYYKVKWTRGVNKILGSGVEPVPMSEKVIQTIRERTGKGNLVKIGRGMERRRPGSDQFRSIQRIDRGLSEKDVRQRTGENFTEFDRCGCSCSNIKVANQKSRLKRLVTK